MASVLEDLRPVTIRYTANVLSYDRRLKGKSFVVLGSCQSIGEKASAAYLPSSVNASNINNKKVVLSQGNRAIPQLFFSV